MELADSGAQHGGEREKCNTGVNSEGSEARQGGDADEKSGAKDPPRVAADALKKDFGTPTGSASQSFDDTNSNAQQQQGTAASATEHAGLDSTAAASLAAAGRGSGGIDADPQVHANDGDDTAAGEDGGTLTAQGGVTHVPRQQDTQTASGQQEQQPAVRAMVPDKEDDDDDELGGMASPRQVTLQNYASRDSGATMLESSPGSKGMSNLLVDSKDKYAISPCEDKQWAVLGLSEDIMVRTIRVSSHEKYSSLVKEFQVPYDRILV